MSPNQTSTIHRFWINETLDRVPDSDVDESVFEEQRLEDLLAADLGAMDLVGTECLAERERQPPSSISVHGALAEDGVRESVGAEHRALPAWPGESEATQHGVDELPGQEVVDDTPAPSATRTHQLQKGGYCRTAHEHGVVSDAPSPPPGCPAAGTTTPPLVPLCPLLPATREAPAHHTTHRARPIWAAMHALLSKSTRYGATHPALLSERFACHPDKTAAQPSEWASMVALLRREDKLKKKIDLLVAETENGTSWDEMPERLREGKECFRELHEVRRVLNSGGGCSEVVLRDRFLGGCRVRCVGVREGDGDGVGM